MKNILKSFLTITFMLPVTVNLMSCKHANKKTVHYHTSVVEYAKKFYDETKPKSWAFVEFKSLWYKKDPYKSFLKDVMQKMFSNKVAIQPDFYNGFFRYIISNSMNHCHNSQFHDGGFKIKECYYIQENFKTGIEKSDPNKFKNLETHSELSLKLTQEFMAIVSKNKRYNTIMQWSKQDEYRLALDYLKGLESKNQCSEKCHEEMKWLEDAIKKSHEEFNYDDFSKAKYEEYILEWLKPIDDIIAEGQKINKIPESYTYE